MNTQTHTHARTRTRSDSLALSHVCLVPAGKRTEEATLREFIETFRGAPFVEEAGAAAAAGIGLVTPAGFSAYYAAFSLFIPHDMHFSNLLFDAWGLYDVDRRAALAAQAGLPGSPSAGKATQGWTAPTGAHSHSFTSSQTVPAAPWAQGGATGEATGYRRGSVQQQQQRTPLRGGGSFAGELPAGAAGRYRR
jgi:hypothetical protein